MGMCIAVEGIICHAFHGCLAEEAIIGGRYRVDVFINTNHQKSLETDNLKDTIDYCFVNDVVREQMAIRSNLIEHVAGRILDKLQRGISMYEKIPSRLSLEEVRSRHSLICIGFNGTHY